MVVKNILPLKFDFKIYTKKSFILLEYDGEFHFDQIYKEENRLEEQQKRDQIKNDYCKNNNIILERIDFSQKKKLNEILKSLDSKYDFLKES